MTPRKPRPYYLLCTREPASAAWAPQFGDYVYHVVAAEREDRRDDWPKGTKFRIIDFVSTGLQSEVDAALARLNGCTETGAA